tara:strand:+ start:140 stop:469 length:330 start_codon:yes stop_codon:yes gene_type:complete
MNDLVNKDSKVNHLKKMIHDLEQSLKQETSEIEKYKKENSHLIEVAKYCADNQYLKKKNDLLKIELIESIYDDLNSLGKKKHITPSDKKKLNHDKKHLNKILQNIYEDM